MKLENLKKVLALVLVVAMMASFATVSAAFPDADSITYTEAVDVLSGLGVIGGYADGTFRPTNTLTRGAFAKMASIIKVGKAPAASYAAAAAAAFEDVAVDATFAAPIGYVASKGIVSGYADGTFRAGNAVTGVAAAKMLLGALGYDADIEGYQNNANQNTNILGDAQDAGLLEGLETVDLSKALTREAAAQMMFNALFAQTVTYSTPGFSITTGDTTVAVGASAAAKGAKLYLTSFPQLAVSTNLTTDDFGAPVKTWTNGGDTKVVAVITSEPVVSYTGAVLDATIKADLNIKTLSSNTTANGKLVEYYANADGLTFTRVDVAYSVGTLAITTDKTTGDVTYTVATGVYGKVFGDGETPATVVLNGTVADKDVVTYVVKNNKLYIYPTTTVSGALTAKSASASYLTIDGTKYYLSTATGSDAVSDYAIGNVAVALDQYGYVVANVTAGPSTAETLVYVVDHYALYNPGVPAQYDAYGNLVTGTGIAPYYEVYAQGVNVAGEEVSYLVAKQSGNTVTSFESNEQKLLKVTANTDGTYTLGTATTALEADVSATAIKYTASSVNYYYDNAKFISVFGNQNTLAVTAGSKAAAANFNSTVWFVFSGDDATNKVVSTVFYYTGTTASSVYAQGMLATGAAAAEQTQITLANGSKRDVYSYEVYINGVKTTVTTYAQTLAKDFYEYYVDNNGIYVLNEVDGAVAQVTNVYGNYVTLTLGSTTYADYDVSGITLVDLRTGLAADGKIEKDDYIAFFAEDPSDLNNDGDYGIKAIYLVAQSDVTSFLP